MAYFCRFADLLTDQDILEMSIPLSLDRRIIVPGAFSTQFDIPNDDIGAKAAKIIPGRTICHVYRGPMIIGSYIIWAKKYASSSSALSLSLQGATIESYLYRRRLQADVIYTSTDQLTIADDLIIRAQLGMGSEYPDSGDLSLSTAAFSTGIYRDRTYLESDGSSIGDLLEDLANVDAGFEYAIQTYQSDTTRPRVMSYGYDKFRPTDNPIVLEEPGGITAWEILYDATKGGTVFWTRGQTSTSTAGEATQPTLSDPSVATEYLDSGWPILEMISDYQNASDVDTLNKYAAWWRTNRSGPIMIPSFTVNAETLFKQGFSPFSLGATMRVILANPAFPLVNGSPSFSGEVRIIGFELTVDMDGKEDMKIIAETEFDPTEVA